MAIDTRDSLMALASFRDLYSRRLTHALHHCSENSSQMKWLVGFVKPALAASERLEAFLTGNRHGHNTCIHAAQDLCFLLDQLKFDIKYSDQNQSSMSQCATDTSNTQLSLTKPSREQIIEWQSICEWHALLIGLKVSSYICARACPSNTFHEDIMMTANNRNHESSMNEIPTASRELARDIDAVDINISRSLSNDECIFTPKEALQLLKSTLDMSNVSYSSSTRIMSDTSILASSENVPLLDIILIVSNLQMNHMEPRVRTAVCEVVQAVSALVGLKAFDYYHSHVFQLFQSNLEPDHMVNIPLKHDVGCETPVSPIRAVSPSSTTSSPTNLSTGPTTSSPVASSPIPSSTSMPITGPVASSPSMPTSPVLTNSLPTSPIPTSTSIPTSPSLNLSFPPRSTSLRRQSIGECSISSDISQSSSHPLAHDSVGWKALETSIDVIAAIFRGYRRQKELLNGEFSRNRQRSRSSGTSSEDSGSGTLESDTFQDYKSISIMTVPMTNSMMMDNETQITSTSMDVMEISDNLNVSLNTNQNDKTTLSIQIGHGFLYGLCLYGMQHRNRFVREALLKMLRDMLECMLPLNLDHTDHTSLDITTSLTDFQHKIHGIKSNVFEYCSEQIQSFTKDPVTDIHEIVQAFACFCAVGLSDNWSQVRFAASLCTRSLFFALPLSNRQVREPVFSALLPRVCINRFYVAQGIKTFSHILWRQLFEESDFNWYIDTKLLELSNGAQSVANNIEAFVDFYIDQASADNHAVREAACQAIAELGEHIPPLYLVQFVPKLLATLISCFKDESWPVRDASCCACGRFVHAFPNECQQVVQNELLELWKAHLWDNIWSVRKNSAVALGLFMDAYGTDAIETVDTIVQEYLPLVHEQAEESQRFGNLKNTSVFSVAKQNRDNDEALHTHQQLYSCGSLAPKLRRGGGCMDHGFSRPKQPWEATDGALYLLVELSRFSPKHASKHLETLYNVTTCRHFVHAFNLQETIWQQVPLLFRNLGVPCIKEWLQQFLSACIDCAKSQHLQAAHSAMQALLQIQKLVGVAVFNARLDESQKRTIYDCLSLKPDEHSSCSFESLMTAKSNLQPFLSKDSLTKQETKASHRQPSAEALAILRGAKLLPRRKLSNA